MGKCKGGGRAMGKTSGTVNIQVPEMNTRTSSPEAMLSS